MSDKSLFQWVVSELASAVTVEVQLTSNSMTHVSTIVSEQPLDEILTLL